MAGLVTSYCTGTIAQFLAKDCNSRWGRICARGNRGCRTNAKENDIKNAFFEVGDMRKIFNKDFINRHGKAKCVITDPLAMECTLR